MAPPAPAGGVSRRPYLLRAMHEWIGDCGHTPHVIVEATLPGVEVPSAYIKDGKIVLNLSLTATQRLQISNDWIEFDARFSGAVHHVRVPMYAVMGIYARETGEGMVFSEADHEPPPQSPPPPPEPVTPQPAKKEARRAKLTVVK